MQGARDGSPPVTLLLGAQAGAQREGWGPDEQRWAGPVLSVTGLDTVPAFSSATSPRAQKHPF